MANSTLQTVGKTTLGGGLLVSSGTSTFVNSVIISEHLGVTGGIWANGGLHCSATASFAARAVFKGGVDISGTAVFAGTVKGLIGVAANNSKVKDTVYQAAVDTIIVAWCPNQDWIDVVNDASVSPTLVVAHNYSIRPTVTFPVKAGTYWKMTTGGQTPVIIETPLGA